MKHWKLCVLALLLPCLLLSSCGEKKPVGTTSVVVWNYYNGKQKDAFEKQVARFNETVGAEKGIVVTSESKGGVEDLSAMVAQSAQGAIGSDNLPQISAAYGDSAYALYQQDMLADFGAYLSEEELSAYIPAFLREGEFASGEYYILPVAKSTELFYLNETDWAPFADATGVSKEDFSTWEGLVKVAGAYYEWSGGKAFFGRDAFANYPIIGSAQLGKEIFSVTDGKVDYQLDEPVLRRLWDGYAAPYLKGWFGAYGRFRSDDAKTGDLLAFVGSTSSVTFFSPEVSDDTGAARAIERGVYPLPQFAGSEPLSVQQGAGMCLLKSDETKEAAAAEFLRWFCAPAQNLAFCVDSGYLPVTAAAASEESMKSSLLESGVEEGSLPFHSAMLGIQTVGSGAMYAPAPFAGGTEARAVLEASVSTMLDGYRAELDGLVGQERDQAIESMFPRWTADLRAALEG